MLEALETETVDPMEDVTVATELVEEEEELETVVGVLELVEELGPDRISVLKIEGISELLLLAIAIRTEAVAKGGEEVERDEVLTLPMDETEIDVLEIGVVEIVLVGLETVDVLPDVKVEDDLLFEDRGVATGNVDFVTEDGEEKDEVLMAVMMVVLEDAVLSMAMRASNKKRTNDIAVESGVVTIEVLVETLELGSMDAAVDVEMGTETGFMIEDADAAFEESEEEERSLKNTELLVEVELCAKNTLNDIAVESDVMAIEVLVEELRPEAVDTILDIEAEVEIKFMIEDSDAVLVKEKE